MTIEDFRNIDSIYRKKNLKLFQISIPDPLASEEQLLIVEKEIGVKITGSYRDFLKEFGGGDYGLITIFSVNPNSEWYLPKKRNELTSYLPNNLLPFSDDFTGGFYVFKIEEDKSQEEIFYWNEDGKITPTEFKNIFEFIIKFSYSEY